MAASDVQIINGALRKLGVPRIGVRNEESEAARVANDTYDVLLDAVLTDAPWDFAVRRQELSANATDPTFGFDNAFDLPSAPYCLKPLEIVNLTEYQWRVENRQILTSHEAPLQLVYIARITTVGSYSPQFVEAFQARLAAEWAEPLIKQSSVQENMLKFYLDKIAAAKTIEAGQTGLHEDTTNGSWVDSRIG
jgi:hypothetical protein